MLKYHFNISEDIKAVVQVQYSSTCLHLQGCTFNIFFFGHDMTVLKNKINSYMNTVLFGHEKGYDDATHFSKECK
jgi:hypothetical protein